ncbi:glycine N-acyltransferase-like protein 3 isoform X2 [Heliangelus exortis]|uniref:glycine N-acyltransferase-like protein 3 isoform X2 n=1 Tax=Heliangelus exortis TaxID=472823 RepID=UPI003A9160AE
MCPCPTGGDNDKGQVPHPGCHQAEDTQVLGAVMTVARGNPAGHQVLVDTWPHFGVVLTRPCPEDNGDPGDFYSNQLSVYYRDEGAWRGLLGDTEAVTWTRAMQIQGMQEGTLEAVQEVTSARGLRLEIFRYRALLCPGLPRPRGQIPPGLRLSPVSPSHVPLLDATWALGGNPRSRRFLRRMLRILPSACLLGPRGRPVSWTLLDPFSCLRHGYTLPAYRGRGLTALPLLALARGLQARGFPVYCWALPQNTPALRALGAVGFVGQPGTFYNLIITPPGLADPPPELKGWDKVAVNPGSY